MTNTPSSASPVDEKIALITGASRGLGAAFAEALAGAYHVVAVARTTGGLEDLDDRIQAKGGQATLAPMDISNADAMAQLCRSIHDRWGKVDLWIHTAAHGAPLTPTDHIDPKDWQKSMAINLDAVARLIPFVSPLLGQEGHAVFFDDDHAGEKFFGSYGATKAAQIALARSWQLETASIGPKVSILSPKGMPTGTRARFFPGEDRDTLTSPKEEAARLMAELDL
ncbi:SDR family NAD(P)-dependent oxidoreductase [Shimia marina]|uniref:Fatty acyl-CoA reductase n=1 Tax=Shimia marina TaxID=321267 RepID=A0A0P1EJW7_9RHOB|nr:SDR family NAD(P)-dependent oxidoreductase [Shimia marina]CUH50625.1 Fatty acyl-CoA reductase [Shimia marina]SFE38551.1 NADP-dependent 3-hydroxy acid dehydrogenase YdfG [Shimia marina]